MQNTARSTSPRWLKMAEDTVCAPHREYLRVCSLWAAALLVSVVCTWQRMEDTFLVTAALPQGGPGPGQASESIPLGCCDLCNTSRQQCTGGLSKGTSARRRQKLEPERCKKVCLLSNLLLCGVLSVLTAFLIAER